jgi:hypothetical protein
MSITNKQREKLKTMLVRGARRKVDREECVRRYLAGERVRDIAEDLGVGAMCIYQNLKAAVEGK